jgi:hypothetical protein
VTRLAARTFTSGATLSSFNLDLSSHAKHGFFESDSDGRLEIPSRLSACLRSWSATEKCVENIAETAESVTRVEAACALTTTARCGMAESVVLLPSFWVGKDLVGLVDLFEFNACIRAFIAVWMELKGLFSERLANVLFRGIAVDLKNLVVVAFGGHGS